LIKVTGVGKCRGSKGETHDWWQKFIKLACQGGKGGYVLGGGERLTALGLKDRGSSGFQKEMGGQKFHRGEKRGNRGRQDSQLYL